MNTAAKDAVIQEKLLQHISKLTIADDGDFVETLSNLEAILISSTHKNVRDIASKLDLTKMFHQFNTVPKELHSPQLLASFGMFLEALQPCEVLIQYFDSVLEGLYSDKNEIVELWIKKVVKTVFTNEALLKQLASSPANTIPLFICVIRLLTSESTMVALAAHDICVNGARVFRLEFFSPGIKEELYKIKQYKGGKVDKDTVKIRFYELCIDISSTSTMLMDLMKVNGFLVDIITEFESKLSADPLVALNMIKLMTDLASQSHGLEFMKQSTSVLQSIAQKIQEVKSDELYGTLFLPGLINFFVRVADFDPTILTQYPIVLDSIYELLAQNSNHEFTILAVDSIAYICRKNEGKILISVKIDTILKAIVSMINSGISELKTRALSALNGMFQIPDSDPGNKSTLLTEEWYQKLDAQGCGLRKMIAIAQEPFAENRLAALTFIRLLASTAWGQKAMSKTDIFLEYLLDRSTETTKQGREAKYEIVRELAMSPYIRLSFPPEVILSIRNCLKEGPVHKDPNVAFENAS